MYRNTLRQILEKKANNNITDMKVRVQGPYIVATVTFEKEEALAAFISIFKVFMSYRAGKYYKRRTQTPYDAYIKAIKLAIRYYSLRFERSYRTNKS